MPATNTLPKNANFENLKKQAKSLHQSLRSTSESTAIAVERVAKYFAQPKAVSLQDAQLVIAREHGFASWAKLKAQIAIAAGVAEAPEQALAKSILRTSNVSDIERFAKTVIRQTLGWQQCHIFKFEMSVGIALGVENPNGQRCLLKILGEMDSPAAEEKRRFQDWLNQKGFACPKILCPVTTIEGIKVVIEDYVDLGRHADGHRADDRKLIAHALYDLLTLSRQYPHKANIPGDTLEAKPNSFWPKPHNVYFDFEATTHGAQWIDQVAKTSKPVMDAIENANVIAHVDWSAKHFMIDNGQIAVIYDWDSVARVPETRAVGAAAAVFAYSEHIDKPNRPSLAEMTGFLQDYETARGERLSDHELAEIWASLKYTAAYGARCEHAIDHANPGTDARDFLRLLGTIDTLKL